MVRAIIKKTLSGVLKDKEEANILLEEAGKKIKEADSLNKDNFRIKNLPWLSSKERKNIDLPIMNLLM